MIRARTWALRVLRFLDWLTPTVREAWVYGVGSLVPFLVLVGGRIFVMKQRTSPPQGWDTLSVQIGEMEFWGVWVMVFVLLGRVPWRRWRSVLRVLLHVCIMLVLAPTLADLNFFLVTGGRTDLDTILFGVEDFARVWPVIKSELRPWHVYAVLGLVSLTLLPVVWTPKRETRTWYSRLWILALLPVIWFESQGRVKPSKAVRDLQPTIAEKLFWEAMDRRQDVFTVPDPADLVPVKIGAPAQPYNVVVILMESVGANRTTLYEPELKTTPNLVKYAGEGVYATNMYAAVTHTTKALITTLCGDWPNLVGDAREAKPGGLPGNCLPGMLRGQGYRTAFFQPAREDFEDRVDLVHQMGYEHFRSRDTLSQPIWEKNNYFGIDDRSMLAPGLEWSQEAPEKPFFATYLTLASHHDYTLPKHVQLLDFPGIGGRLEKYLNAVRYVDDFTGRLIRAYEQRGLADHTLFVILGDHGEGFGEHGRYQHDLTIYEEGLHIPFVMVGKEALAGRTGKIEGNRQQIDVVPTILEAIGAPVTEGKLRGSSLFSPPPEGRVLFHSCWRSHRCLARREGNTVFLDHYGEASSQVFDVAEDPGEKSDLGRKFQKERGRWQEETRAWYGRVRGRYEARQAQVLDGLQHPDDRAAIASWGGGELSLLGCRAEQAEAIPAEEVWVQCDWRAERQINDAWTLVAQLVASKRTGQVKWTPLMGALRMWNWKIGHAVSDTFRVSAPAYTRAGDGVIRVSWQGVTGNTVLTDKGDEFVDVASVAILPRPKQDPAKLEGIAEDNPPVRGEEWSLPPLAPAGTAGNAAEPEGDLDVEPPVSDDRATPALDPALKGDPGAED